MNESEVEEHRIESGEEFLLITAKVIFFCSCESERSESGKGESGSGKAQARKWGKVSGDLLCSCESERGESESGRGKAKDRRCFC